MTQPFRSVKDAFQEMPQLRGPILVTTPTTVVDFIDLPLEERANFVQSVEDQACARLNTVPHILALEKTTQYEKHKMIFRAIWQDLSDRGVIYRESVPNPDKDVPRLYFYEPDRPIIDLFGRQMGRLLAEYGLQHDSLLIKVAKHICERAEQDGKAIRIVSNYSYDEGTYTLYANLGHDNILKMSPSSVEVIPNGSEGLLFPQFSTEPLDIDLDAIRSCELGMRIEPGSLAFEYFNASYDDELMPAAHWHQLSVSRILAMFFPEAFNSRSLLAFIGEAGCGKTIVAQKIGWALEGGGFQVDAVMDDLKEMETLLTSKTFVVLDNCDSSRQMKKHASILCRVCTGGQITRRMLYSNNSHISFPLIANVVITAISGGFIRDTLASRTLIVPLKPRDRQAASGGHNFSKDAKSKRTALMTEMLGRARNILAALEAQADYQPLEDTRLQDLTGFIMRCAIHEGWSDLGADP
jgi:hypothetical protein